MLNLNSGQTAAVNFQEGAVAVLAGPGSGKTACLVARYKRLISEGIKPEEILSLTFTSNSANEMRTRAKAEKNLRHEKPHGFMTFHALALRMAILERDSFSERLAEFPLATESALYALDAVKKYRINYKDFRTWMSDQKRNRIDAAAALRDADTQQQINFAMAYRDYEDACATHGVLDFDSLIIEMVGLLERDASIRNRWSYKFIQTDESQDSDALQWHAVQLMSEKHGNVFAVGDAGQAIYDWRGADSQLFLNFDKLFPDAQKLFLAKNHRSSKSIVRLLKEVGPVRELAEKFWTDNNEGEEVEYQSYPTNVHEAEAIVEQVRKMNGRLF